jgi:hypothetical protein
LQSSNNNNNNNKNNNNASIIDTAVKASQEKVFCEI